MEKQVVVVEANHRDEPDSVARAASSPHRPPVDPARGPGTEAARQPGKFLYHGGDRPLEGYTIKRGIGHGGFGEIYYATSDGGKEVALKLIRRNLEIELRGIRHCLNLKHPNLLDLYDIRQDAQGDTWVVMEYVPGASLEEALDAQPNGLPPEQAVAWLYGIAAGVAYLHDRGIVHRDLKPGNVFSSEGVVKVGDYGLSKFISCSRRSGHTESIGTVHYMAPEVANGRYGKEIDIYAMGIMLYEMLTGRVPFEGESVGEVLMKHLTAQPDLSMLAEPYRSVVARALEKDPEKRFHSVGEMLAGLPAPAQAPPGAARLPGDSGVSRAAAGSARRPSPWDETVIRAQVADEEPIARAVRETWWKLRRQWDEANLNTPAKVGLIVLGLLVLLAGAQVMFPLVISLLIFYGVYRLVRAVVLKLEGRTTAWAPRPRDWAPGGSPAACAPAFGTAGATSAPPGLGGTTPPVAPLAPTGPSEGHRRFVPSWHRRGRREAAAAALAVKPGLDRFTELLGSMIVGSLVAVVMCVVMLLIKSYRTGVPQPELCAWLALVSILGTWAVLVPAKFWEGTHGEPILRRFILMVIGFGVGAAAYGLASLLLVGLPADAFPEAPYRMPDGFYGDGGHPLILAHLAAFGALFFIMRWWKQADPLRPTRLAFGALIVSVVIAGLVAGLTQFPQPWLSMVAGAVSVAVQLSSPWVNPRADDRSAVG